LGFIISFLIGLVSGVVFPALILRPLISAALFFAVVFFVQFAVSRFLPELLENSPDSNTDFDMPGSRIDITEGSGPAESIRPAVPGSPVFSGSFAKADDSDEGLGDISAFVSPGSAGSAAAEQQDESRMFRGMSPGLDQGGQNRYTEQGSADPFSAPGGGAGGSGAGSTDFLPDLDSLAGAFMPSAGGNGEETVEYSTSEPAKRPSASSKGQKMEGDFNPKDLAAGIRTILNKEG
jgi:hypothetical protein